MSLSYPGVLAQQPSDMGNDVRFSNTLKQGWANLLSLDTTLDVPLGFTKLICFCCKFNDSSYAICQMPASKGKCGGQKMAPHVNKMVTTKMVPMRATVTTNTIVPIRNNKSL